MEMPEQNTEGAAWSWSILIGISLCNCLSVKLTLKSLIMTAVDDIHKYFLFSEKIRLDVSSESSARQRIHLKHQALFSRNIKVKY